MAAKPPTVPRWAETILGVQSGVIVPPIAKMDIGFTKGERPPNEYVDWLFNTLGRWMQYLSDGELEGNHAIDGGLDITEWLEVGGALAVGNEATFTGLLAGALGLVADTDQHITVQGTGQFKHGDRTLPIVPLDAYMSSCAWDLGNGWVASSGINWSCLIDPGLPIGKRIKSVTVERFGTGAGTFDVYLRKISPGATAPTTVSVLNAGAIGAAWADSTLDVSPDEQIAAGEYVYVHVNGSVSGQRFKNVRVVYDEP